MPMWMSLSFQDSNSMFMENLMFLHDQIMVFLMSITALILYLMVTFYTSSFFWRKNLEHQDIEIFWTSLPAVILTMMATPSLKVLYFSEEVVSPSMTLKTIGHQWFWSYEYSEMKKIQFDSYMLNDSIPRLIQTNNHIVCPSKTPIRLIVTSTDVIHSWTIPSLGVKADAIPGRLNQLFLLVSRPGIYTGQCSEICGTNHSFMPITLSSIPSSEFLKSIKNI
uniref:Cytochrome c oxidase subunit 2 n=1 Tax=Unionicola foili TaxID=350889 RepID=B3W610_9ACAR|nr:cytochrome c oxidase subunit II [Unionicola foili]ACF19637.1 cytochrome oxidase subunit 2 [Unionicola foili]